VENSGYQRLGKIEECGGGRGWSVNTKLQLDYNNICNSIRYL
jgi:hypothetical protein